MNTTQEQYTHPKKTTLSSIGAVIYAVLATVFSCLCTRCLQTDAQQAALSVLSPVFLFAAGCFATVLAIHGQKVLFSVCAVASVVCSFALTYDFLRSLACIGAYVCALFIMYACSSSKLTYSGAICVLIAIYAAFILYAFGVLCYQKYGSLTLDGISRAIDSFFNILMQAPEAALARMQAEFAGDAAYASLLSEYERSVKLLRELLKLSLYVIPYAFLYICSIGAFITVRCAQKHRHMQGLPDMLGAFYVSPVTAVVYTVSYFILIFIEPTSALGVTLNTVMAVPGLGLALFGFLYLYYNIKFHPKRQLYTVLLVLALVFFTGAAQSILAFTGAYKTVQLYLAQRSRDKEGRR